MIAVFFIGQTGKKRTRSFFIGNTTDIENPGKTKNGIRKFVALTVLEIAFSILRCHSSILIQDFQNKSFRIFLGLIFDFDRNFVLM